MNTQPIKQALEGYNGDINERIRYSEWIRRMGPHWLQQLMEERERMVEQLRRISGTPTAGLAAAIASNTLKEIGEDEYAPSA